MEVANKEKPIFSRIHAKLCFKCGWHLSPQDIPNNKLSSINIFASNTCPNTRKSENVDMMT